MRSTLIPASRNTSPDWAARERERPWPRVRHLAATIDHLPDPGGGHALRAAFMDILDLERLAPGDPRLPRPHRMTLTPEQAKTGLAFEQDVANMARAQRGLHQPGLIHLVISHEEMRMANLHRNLVEWRGEPGSNGSTATAAGT